MQKVDLCMESIKRSVAIWKHTFLFSVFSSRYNITLCRKPHYFPFIRLRANEKLYLIQYTKWYCIYLKKQKFKMRVSKEQQLLNEVVVEKRMKINSENQISWEIICLNAFLLSFLYIRRMQIWMENILDSRTFSKLLNTIGPFMKNVCLHVTRIFWQR